MKTITRFIGFALLMDALKVGSALAICVVASGSISMAQSGSGNAALEGLVKDSSGALISGAITTARNTDTGLQRAATTDDRGRFTMPALPVGRYVVKVAANGFGEVTRSDVVLSVGETSTVDITLQPATITAQVDVTADQQLLDPKAHSASSVIPERSVEDLPARGRNFSEYIQLTPSVIQESDRFGLVIAGQRSINSNVAIDGADFNDALQGNQRGGNEAVFFFPQTAVREFQVLRAGATAEVGRTSAGFVNVATKSGTNDVHGEALYFNRNRSLTSKDAFGNKLDNQQNQFGGSIGGPIVRDHALFFAGLEQNFLHIPFVVKFASPAAGVSLPADVQGLQGEQRTSNNPTSLFGRVDWQLSKISTLNLQYTYSRLHGQNFNFDNNTTVTDLAPTTNFERTGTSNGFKSAFVSVLSSSVVNEMRGQIATDKRFEGPNSNLPQISIAGFGTLGGDNARPRLFETTRFELADNLTVDVSAHRLRFGFDTNINRAHQERESNIQGRYDFETRVNSSGALVADSVSNFVSQRPRRFRQTIPGFNPDDLIFHGTQRELAFFAQDNIAVTRAVTLTAGLRWEGQWNPQPTHPNPAIPETALIPDDLRMWQPRLGLAWDAAGKGKTVVRLSAGIYDARTPANLFQRVFTDNGLTTLAVDISETSACRNSTDPNLAGCLLRGPNAIIRFPNVFTTVPAASFITKPRVFGFDSTFRNPRSFQFSSTIEQDIGGQTFASVGYIHGSTWALQRRLDRNLLPPTLSVTGMPIFPATRPNPTIGVLSINESTAHSTYDAMTLSLTRHVVARTHFQVNYTLARNRDDDSNERNFSRETTLNPFDLAIEDAPSKQDVRHNLSVNGLFDLGRGFTASGIIIARSGVPFNQVIGTDTQNDLNDDNDRAIIDKHVAARNAVRQPRFFNLDLRLLKSFRLSEARRLALSVEAFNVTRNTNKGFGNDGISIYGVPLSDGSPSVLTAGKPLFAPSTARFGGPRQVQLGARFIF
ncbi:MAG TPA: TonB-dependent receptor [Blastocatellia bacterium]|jgi:hypothetical protein|nr:TonB-dependent receptor [Blastocatellia bacterium]